MINYPSAADQDLNEELWDAIEEKVVKRFPVELLIPEILP